VRYVVILVTSHRSGDRKCACLITKKALSGLPRSRMTLAAPTKRTSTVMTSAALVMDLLHSARHSRSIAEIRVCVAYTDEENKVYNVESPKTGRLRPVTPSPYLSWYVHTEKAPMTINNNITTVI
jgi:hypothetical protein